MAATPELIRALTLRLLSLLKNPPAAPIVNRGRATPKGGIFMLPDVSHPAWTQFVTGKKPLQSGKATLNLLIQSNKMSYERDPSPANVRQLATKTHRFFSHFEAIFSSEIATILE